MDRKERVKQVHEFINTHEGNEKNFDKLYSKLLEEYNAEMSFNSDLRTNHYLNDLRQTMQKQAETYMYMKRRRPKKGAPTEFRDFVSNFRHDVTWSLR